MEKLGVEVEKEKAKLAAEEGDSRCPSCGRRLVPEAAVPKCPSCGTRPFEAAQ